MERPLVHGEVNGKGLREAQLSRFSQRADRLKRGPRNASLKLPSLGAEATNVMARLSLSSTSSDGHVDIYVNIYEGNRPSFLLE